MHTATFIQSLLMEEGAYFHSAMRVLPIASMGGGYGVVAMEQLDPCTILAVIPRNSMITASKARRYLAERECKQRHAMSCGKQFPERSVSTTAVETLELELSKCLSQANTIICFLLIAAAEHGRFLIFCDNTLSDVSAVTTTATEEEQKERKQVECGHAWMKTWIHSLPVCYDNLLELRPEVDSEEGCLNKDGIEANGVGATEAYLRPYIFFDRHRRKILLEHANIDADFEVCKSSLFLLHALPKAQGCKSLSVTFEQFLWAYNTLMSRAFAYEPEVWALIPWVDYFNYALSSNATMRFDEDRDAYIFETQLPINTGEQIMLHYGSYTDMELLLWYGFTLRPLLLPELSRSNTLEERARALAKFLWCSGESTAVADGTQGARDDTWLNAVHRALGHSFSLWANADGTYPLPKPRESWIELLLISYNEKSKNFMKNGHVLPFSYLSCAAAAAAKTAAAAADLLVRKLVGPRAQQTLPQQLVSYDCRLGARGPSPAMLRLLKYISRVYFLHGTKGFLTPCDILRAICWAELLCNYQDLRAGHTFVFENGGASLPADGVKIMAWQASFDVASLLYLLALEADDERLCRYLSMECS